MDVRTLGAWTCMLAGAVTLAVGACGDNESAEDPTLDSGAPSSSSSSSGNPARDAGERGDASVEADADTDAAPGDDVVPRQLTCLAGHFVGTVVDLSELADAGADAGTLFDAGAYDAGRSDAGAGAPLEAERPPSRWGLRLPNGVILPWDDGRAKSFDETIERPDLQDTLFMRYHTGAIVPVNTLDEDPGRIRADELFKATYGGSSAQVSARLETVSFVGQNLKFHERSAEALTRVSAKLEALIDADPSMARYVTGELGGTFGWRVILNTNRLSVHSFGSAIDIRVAYSHYWEWDGQDFEWQNDIPQAIVDVFESEKFVWGGRWYHYDTMHFEYRPELFDPECAL